MKLNKLFSPLVLMIALLVIAVWGGWGQKLLSARNPADVGLGQADQQPAERNQDQTIESKDTAKAPGKSSSSIDLSDGDKKKSDEKALEEAEKNNEKTRELLQKSIALLRNRSFRSQIRQRGMLFGTELIASGTYLHADGGKGGVRTELELQTKNLNLQVEMVNDGVFFFRRVKSMKDDGSAPEDETSTEEETSAEEESSIDDKNAPSVERINLRQVREEVSPDHTWPGHWIAFGGLYTFLDQSRRCFDFGPVATKKIKGEEFDVLKGTWKPEKLASLVPAQKTSILNRHAINWQRIPKQIPLEVEIYFSKKGELSGFPFRVVFYRPNEELLDSMRNVPVLITEYSDAQFIETPVHADFQFNADENEVVDITENFLNSLRR